MDSQLNPEARAKLRKFLRKHFNLEELKDLAFDLGIPYESDVKLEALSREMIEYSERKETLSCLIVEVMSTRSKVDTSDLGEMLGKLPPCKKRAKVQVIFHGINKEFPPRILAEIAEWAGTPPDGVELIAAAPGSIHLLLSLSEEKAGTLIAFWRNRLIKSKYEVKSVKNFDALPQLTQITWRVLVVYSPFSGLSLLETNLFWEEITDLIKRGHAATADIHPEIPRPALLNYYSGLILLRLKRWERAVLNFSRSLNILPHFAEAHLRRGIAYYHLGQYEAALADYDAAIKYDPSLVDAYNYRGALYAKLSKYDKALEDFNQAIRLGPDASISYTNRGSALYHLGRYKDALADFNQAIHLDQLNKRAYICRGFTLTKLGRHREALADFTRAIELDPDEARTYVHRGIVYERLGRDEEALQDFQYALRLDPNNERVRNIIQELNTDDTAVSIYSEIVGKIRKASDDFEMEAKTASSSVGTDYSDKNTDDINM